MTNRPAPLLAVKHPERSRAARVPAPIRSDGAVTGAWAHILGLASDDVVTVTPQQVRGLPALDRAKALVRDSVTAMMVAATVTDPDGRPVPKPSVIARPHPLLTAVEFYDQVADNLVMHGNHISIKAGEGEVLQLIPVPLGGVSVDTSSGLPEYKIGGRTYRHWEVVHFRANAPVGSFWGQGVVERFRRALDEQLHAQQYGKESFKSGSVPSIDVTLDVDNPSPEQLADAKVTFVETFGGGAREPIVHGRLLKLSPLSWSPHDAEFVESRRLSIAEAAYMCGLRPEDLGASVGGQGITYGNRSDDALQRITDSYAPWAARIEGPLSDLLAPGYTVHANPEALLRMSTRERLELREIAQRIGIETPDESRAEEGRGPIHVTETGDA